VKIEPPTSNRIHSPTLSIFCAYIYIGIDIDIMAETPDRETLVKEITELQQVLDRTRKADEAKLVEQGKPFDLLSWARGEPIDQKYPAGPIYRVCFT
jgi:hypothetical protein